MGPHIHECPEPLMSHGLPRAKEVQFICKFSSHTEPRLANDLPPKLWRQGGLPCSIGILALLTSNTFFVNSCLPYICAFKLGGERHIIRIFMKNIFIISCFYKVMTNMFIWKAIVKLCTWERCLLLKRCGEYICMLSEEQRSILGVNIPFKWQERVVVKVISSSFKT